MKDPEDKTIYNRIIQQNRLYQFLAGVDETLDKDRRDILNRDPLPTPEEAFGIIKREIHIRGIMNSAPPKPSTVESSGIGGGFAVKSRMERPNFRREDDKTGLKCTHCGGTRHTRKGCFELIGYPEWWGDRKKKGEKKSSGNTVVFTDEGAAAKEEGNEKDPVIIAARREKESGIKGGEGCSNRGDYWAWY